MLGGVLEQVLEVVVLEVVVLDVVVLEEVVLAVLQEEVVSLVVTPHQVGVVEVVIHGFAPVMEVLVPQQLCGKV